jgi:hypothetical protein
VLFDSRIYNKLYLFIFIINHICLSLTVIDNTIKSDIDLFKLITVYHLNYSSELLSFTLYFGEPNSTFTLYFGSPP